MSWTAPTTRTTGTLITSAIYNTDLVDNLSYLKTKADQSIAICRVFLPGQALAAGDDKYRFKIPSWLNGATLTGVEASIFGTASSSGAITIMVRNATTTNDMLSTAMTIDEGEFTTADAATPAVINTSYDDVSSFDTIAIDMDAIGTGVAGLQVNLKFYLA